MSQINQIKEAVNIVEIIGEKIRLQRSGSSFKANCPFHSEKTPSFFVNEQMQRYKCFGCGAHGDVLDFLQNYEGMTLLEGLRFLADKTGIRLEEYHKTPVDDERDTLLAILDLSKEYYSYLLNKHQIGKKAKTYLEERGISASSIKLFQIGYALPSWDGLIKYLHQKKKYKLEDIEKTGLIIKKNNYYYDRFRDRIIFPLKNHRGQIVGFSGRLLSADTKEAKYINTPETSLYHKSEMLYGFSELFHEIKKKNQVIVTEGEFDVISSAQIHVNNVVAIKGSALTEKQARLLERVAEVVLLALDMDEAGIKATIRAISIIENSNLELRVIDLSASGEKSKDPDELARNNPKLWREISNKSMSVYEYLIKIALKKFDSTKPEGKSRIINELAPVIKNITHAVEKDYYLKKLSDELNVSLSVIKEDIEKFGKKLINTSSNQEEKNKAKNQDKNKLEKLEKYLLFLLFRGSVKKIKIKAEKLSEVNLKILGANQIIKSLLEFKPEFSLEKFVLFLAEDLKISLMDWYEDPELVKLLPDLKLEQEYKKMLMALKQEETRRKIEIINQQIEELDSKQVRSTAENEKINKWLKQIVTLQSKQRI